MMEIIAENIPIYFDLQEICDRCLADANTVIKLVECGVVEPEGRTATHWRFSANDYLRLRRALRLKRDLEINEPGIALVLEVLDELQAMRAELKRLRRRLLI